ncbi:MAG: hypothetical protein HC771_24220 [Synechococcales cyanobacterium CRU_2_2]|nr:hypothetical protein [Synechococcales cyanobacterium CRU_2_2]
MNQELEIGQIVAFPKASRELEKYVMDELGRYKKQVESKLSTFEQLAKRYSEDPGSKERGGEYQVNRNDKTWDRPVQSPVEQNLFCRGQQQIFTAHHL